jgi:hypothetical protein
VCEKLCIPVEASAELGFNSVASTEDANLRAALDTVPKPANIGDPNPLTIRDVKRDGPKNVVVDVVAPADTRKVNLFVEGPTPDWSLPIPAPVEPSPPGVKRFSFELDGLPPGAKPEGAALKFTLVGPEKSYEFNTNLERWSSWTSAAKRSADPGPITPGSSRDAKLLTPGLRQTSPWGNGSWLSPGRRRKAPNRILTNGC